MKTLTSKQGFEVTVCGRCGGSGKYSYNQMDGDRCFGCRGAGNVYTKRGQAAVNYLASLRSVRADQIVVGMTIHTGKFSNTFVVVNEVLPYDNTGTVSKIDGIVQPNRDDLLTIVSDDLKMCGYAPETVFVVKQTKEERVRTLALAIAFQSTLDEQSNVDHELLASVERSAASEDRSLGY